MTDAREPRVKAPPTPAAWRVADSPVGRLFLAAAEEGLAAVTFLDVDDPGPALERLRATGFSPDLPAAAGAARVLEHAAGQLAEYFAGDRRRFELPLALRGTDFQRRVWRALETIPFGETRTYGALAADLGRPDAVRAVGAANGANPLPVVLPCHRVVGADDSLTGYGGGLERKRWLLAHERGDRLPLDR